MIAPIGYRVFDRGRPVLAVPDRLGPAEVRPRFQVEGSTQGSAVGRILDLEKLYAEHAGVLIPDTLVSSARDEPGTPYWFTPEARHCA